MAKSSGKIYLLTAVSLLAALCTITTSDMSEISAARKNSPEGWLMWHSYTEYSSGNSALYVRSPQGKVTEIKGNFNAPMNGDFGCSPNDIIFMAIDENADEWDIYRCDMITGKITDLTENSGFRNEDPKFSPDGKRIVFKRGHWDASIDNFVYNIAELDLSSGDIKYLTDDINEEAMPCYSADGKYVIFANYINGISSICRIDTETGITETLYSENNVTAYYPIVRGENIYFTKWHSSENRNDMILCYNDQTITELTFNDPQYNVSDACPAGDEEMIYSSTKNGSYDLFYYNGTKEYPIEYASTEKNELGANFYSVDEAKEYLNGISDFLLGTKTVDTDRDIDKNGCTDCYDLIALRKYLCE